MNPFNRLILFALDHASSKQVKGNHSHMTRRVGLCRLHPSLPNIGALRSHDVMLVSVGLH